MSALFLLNITPRGPYNFQPVLDGNLYNAQVRWGLFGQRPYLFIYSLTGTRIVTKPVAGSPDPIATTSLTWDQLEGTVDIEIATTHGIPVGALANLTISGVTPTAYNGLFEMISTGPTSLSYDMMTDPGGDATVQGTVVQNINLIAGYFNSTLVWRQSTGFFEVNP